MIAYQKDKEPFKMNVSFSASLYREVGEFTIMEIFGKNIRYVNFNNNSVIIPMDINLTESEVWKEIAQAVPWKIIKDMMQEREMLGFRRGFLAKQTEIQKVLGLD